MIEKKKLEKFESLAREVAQKLKGFKEALVISHDDADGLCSASITIEGLRRQGIKSKFFCLEKVYPEVLEKIHNERGRLIFYCDIGSSHSDLISRLNKSRNLVVILDHHEPSAVSDSKVFDLNLERFGFLGERDFSGATCCYFFFRTLDKKNVDLSYLALVGSLEIPTGLEGINKNVLEDALKSKIVELKGKKLIVKKFSTSCNELFSMLQILGAVGYYKGGPELGVDLCLHGVTGEIRKIVKQLEELRKKANKKMLAILYKGGLEKSGKLQWFFSRNIYKGMGTKVIGQFCSFLSYQGRLIDQDKYLLGFMEVEDYIPGFGKLEKKYFKVSARAPRKLRESIEKGLNISVVELLKKASIKIGGIADGHQFAASAIIPKEKAREFLEELKKITS